MKNKASYRKHDMMDVDLDVIKEYLKEYLLEQERKPRWTAKENRRFINRMF